MFQVAGCFTRGEEAHAPATGLRRCERPVLDLVGVKTGLGNFFWGKLGSHSWVLAGR